MIRVQNATNKDQYLVMNSEDRCYFGACEKALKFEVVVTDTGRVIYEEESTGQALQLEYEDQETLILGRRMNAVETQSEPSELPPTPSAAQEGQAGKKKKKKNKSKKKPKKSVDTQQKTSETMFMQTHAYQALQIATTGLNRFEGVARTYKTQIQRLKNMLRIVSILLTWGYWTDLARFFLMHPMSLILVVWMLVKLDSLIAGPGVVEVQDQDL
jgi:hypothetical protein